MHSTIELLNETVGLHDVVRRVMQGEEIVILTIPLAPMIKCELEVNGRVRSLMTH